MSVTLYLCLVSSPEENSYRYQEGKKGKQHNLIKCKSESDAGKNVSRGDTAIVGGHRSIGVRADRRRARPRENRQDARGGKTPGSHTRGGMGKEIVSQ